MRASPQQGYGQEVRERAIPGPDSPITYTLTFTNSGEIAITDPVITDTLPSDAEGPLLLLDEDASQPYGYSLLGLAPPRPTARPCPSTRLTSTSR
ncbi:hypothetical protein G7085_16360 [Tessaracoccus sp. HDW20]|uniref:hypothetical protein n=1 Tax=Tessaracoccus coleopterorum TaxID=2714950 RepID=UPI0018D440ED|nr:hypothetical protein [Tessaracoccus coleopterorum]